MAGHERGAAAQISDCVGYFDFRVTARRENPERGVYTKNVNAAW